jgi:hypothetical protein
VWRLNIECRNPYTERVCEGPQLKRGPELLRTGLEEVLAALDPIRTATFPTADSLNYLLAIVVQGAEEHPTLQTVEAVALLTALVLLVSAGWVCAVR